ncbi:hypothetical protein KY290_023363 [Solanum tuberosum]|uniref:Uncharacterized protein n=1 Tax=Solanum tuberosum TaxID=4113 RepID=A0ABQ7V707_SOLTU|nr:hypothetical protein KY289_020513 [Solanum tuberosum]KAH0693175.1 hypothetical protein KY285_020272 [Solanum tuberosum]KAH0759870.1 hypothetical protein KY290_023363 [Solanum tuberosum]
MLCARGGQKLSPYLCAHVSGFHTSKNFAEEERNGDARVSLLLLSSSIGFAGDYLAFAGVGCSPVRADGAAVCCCRPHWSGGEERKRLAGRSWPAWPSLAGKKNGSEAAPGCRLVFAAARWPAPFAASPELLGE